MWGLAWLVAGSSNAHSLQIIRKVVRRISAGDEEKEVILEGSLQEPQELEAEADHFMKYAILHQDSLGSKVQSLLLSWPFASSGQHSHAPGQAGLLEGSGWILPGLLSFPVLFFCCTSGAVRGHASPPRCSLLLASRLSRPPPCPLCVCLSV